MPLRFFADCTGISQGTHVLIMYCQEIVQTYEKRLENTLAGKKCCPTRLKWHGDDGIDLKCSKGSGNVNTCGCTLNVFWRLKQNTQ